jgi:DNA-binding CsgD family transcriptional regulator
MTDTTSADAYEQYRLRCGGTPVLTQAELRVEIRAAGLGYEELDEEFWTALFRRPDHRHLG